MISPRIWRPASTLLLAMMAFPSGLSAAEPTVEFSGYREDCGVVVRSNRGLSSLPG